MYHKIIEEGYYWNTFSVSFQNFIKNCYLCVAKNKSNILPPPTNQILYDKSRELYVIYITEVPIELNNNINEKIYLLSILDHFSKFAYNYILNKKDQNSVLINIKKFIKKYGLPQKILTDNGGEFTNNQFKKYCKKNDIILIHGRSRHPKLKELWRDITEL